MPPSDCTLWHSVVNNYRVFGAAWTGELEVVKVEISTDGGQSWQEVRLLDKPAPFTWRRWELLWPTSAKIGRRTLLARATDKRGQVQPMQRDKDCRDAAISQALPIEVAVR